jgi:hypothetical protein
LASVSGGVLDSAWDHDRSVIDDARPAALAGSGGLCVDVVAGCCSGSLALPIKLARQALELAVE